MKFSIKYVKGCRRHKLKLLALAIFLILAGCHQQETESDDSTPSEVRTPVSVTSVNFGPLQQYIELNATAEFLQKSFVKANLNGYIKKVNIKLGDVVHNGEILFVLKTKEAEAIGNSVNSLDPGFKFSGVNNIPANSNGYIAELNHQQGDYVQDGEQLAVIADSKSFVFVMNVPYEDRDFVNIGKHVQVILPGEENLQGIITSEMPVIDSVSQTQSFTVKVNAYHSIPQNLIARVKIEKESKQDAATLPKGSVLSDETQSNFFVMKMINDTTAVKVPVKTGIEMGDSVEIVSPLFSPQDKILLTGNYGLPDTALVIVHK